MSERKNMANWTDSKMTVILPTRNVEKLKGFFLSEKEKENETKERYFFRTSLNRFCVAKTKNGSSIAKADFSCAWSLAYCLLDNDRPKEYITIDEAVKELGIKRLVATSLESGEGLEESITFDKSSDSVCVYEVHKMIPDPDLWDLDDMESLDEEESESE